MLKTAGILNIILAIVHVVSLFWARQVFEAGGIGAEMERVAQIHPSLPYIVTIIVAIVFFIFGLYALSANGNIRKLPLLKTGIFGIAALYILRALMGVAEIVTANASVLREGSYSLVALLIGWLYLAGGLKTWRKHNATY